MFVRLWENFPPEKELENSGVLVVPVFVRERHPCKGDLILINPAFICFAEEWMSLIFRAYKMYMYVCFVTGF